MDRGAANNRDCNVRNIREIMTTQVDREGSA
jgi:hypothetical protein